MKSDYPFNPALFLFPKTSPHSQPHLLRSIPYLPHQHIISLSALCLSAAIEAPPDPEPDKLQKLLPRVLKLVKSDGFKAKPALLCVIGSIVGAGGAGLNQNSLSLLVNCLVEFLSSGDWAARKAAVEALGGDGGSPPTDSVCFGGGDFKPYNDVGLLLIVSSVDRWSPPADSVCFGGGDFKPYDDVGLATPVATVVPLSRFNDDDDLLRSESICVGIFDLLPKID